MKDGVVSNAKGSHLEIPICEPIHKRNHPPWRKSCERMTRMKMDGEDGKAGKETVQPTPIYHNGGGSSDRRHTQRSSWVTKSCNPSR